MTGELKAQVAWKENRDVSGLRSMLLFNPTLADSDIEIILRVVFREKRNGKL